MAMLSRNLTSDYRKGHSNFSMVSQMPVGRFPFKARKLLLRNLNSKLLRSWMPLQTSNSLCIFITKYIWQVCHNVMENKWALKRLSDKIKQLSCLNNVIKNQPKCTVFQRHSLLTKYLFIYLQQDETVS